MDNEKPPKTWTQCDGFLFSLQFVALFRFLRPSFPDWIFSFRRSLTVLVLGRQKSIEGREILAEMGFAQVVAPTGVSAEGAFRVAGSVLLPVGTEGWRLARDPITHEDVVQLGPARDEIVHLTLLSPTH